MRDLRFLFALCLLLFFSQDLTAQYRYGYFRVGVSAGSTNYLGDLDDDFTFKYTRPGIGIQGSYHFNPFMTARLEFFRGWISAKDALSNNLQRNRRNLSFSTPITEASFTVAFDFIPQIDHLSIVQYLHHMYLVEWPFSPLILRQNWADSGMIFNPLGLKVSIWLIPMAVILRSMPLLNLLYPWEQVLELPFPENLIWKLKPVSANYSLTIWMM